VKRYYNLRIIECHGLQPEKSSKDDRDIGEECTKKEKESQRRQYGPCKRSIEP
jgi:hypothetical protein